MATARVQSEPAADAGSDSQFSPTDESKLADVLKIPEGYQDEDGFHCGVPEPSVLETQLEYISERRLTI